MSTVTLSKEFIDGMAIRFPQVGYMLSEMHGRDGMPLSPADWVRGVGGLGGDAPDLDKIKWALAAQCGCRWNGVEAEAPIRQVALVALAAYASGFDITPLLADINRLMASGGGCDEALEALSEAHFKAAAPVIEDAGCRHFWSNTVAMHVVWRAKTCNGVLPNSWFLWLKKHDRIMWLALSGYGRHVMLAETLGATAHFHAERIMGRPLEEVWMDPAVRCVADQVGG